MKIGKKNCGGRGGMRVAMWWVNRKLAQEKADEYTPARSMDQVQKRRKTLYKEYKELPEETQRLTEREFEHQQRLQEVEAPEPITDTPLPWGPVGLSSEEWPVSVVKIDKHMETLSERMNGRVGLQYMGEHIEELRRDDPSAITHPFITVEDMKRTSSTFNQKEVAKQMKRDRTCAQLHPGICVRDDAMWLDWMLEIHRFSFSKIMDQLSEKHTQEGKQLLAFLARPAEDLSGGDVVEETTKLRFAYLSHWNLSKHRGVFTRGVYLGDEVLLGSLHFPFDVAVQFMENGTIDEGTSHRFAYELAETFEPMESWTVHVVDYIDLSLEASGLQYYMAKRSDAIGPADMSHVGSNCVGAAEPYNIATQRLSGHCGCDKDVRLILRRRKTLSTPRSAKLKRL